MLQPVFVRFGFVPSSSVQILSWGCHVFFFWRSMELEVVSGFTHFHQVTFFSAEFIDDIFHHDEVLPLVSQLLFQDFLFFLWFLYLACWHVRKWLFLRWKMRTSKEDASLDFGKEQVKHVCNCCGSLCCVFLRVVYFVIFFFFFSQCSVMVLLVVLVWSTCGQLAQCVEIQLVTSWLSRCKWFRSIKKKTHKKTATCLTPPSWWFYCILNVMQWLCICYLLIYMSVYLTNIGAVPDNLGAHGMWLI